jgi:glutamine amidotransferase
MITIVDCGMGNLGSIQNMLKKIDHKSVITGKISDIEKAEKIILPGVGAFDNGMKNLKKMKLISVLNQKVLKEKTPVLGICLGMQLMTLKSEEGKLPGLGWIEAETIRFNFNGDKNLKIPHMGWNNVKVMKNNGLSKDIHNNDRFYFVHSYFVKLKNSQDQLFETEYGSLFTSSFSKGNIFGVQFHPEKSHKYGMQLLKNFAENI